MTNRRATPEAIVNAVGRRLGTATVLFHAAVADRMGIGVTDARCRMLLLESGPQTAGELGERLGVTTGAVTGIVDRLVGAGLAERIPDPDDGRRVVVGLVKNPASDRALARLSAPMGARIRRLAGTYSGTERAAIADFLTRASEVLEEEAIRLRRARRSTRR